jgi:hypothetical protein
MENSQDRGVGQRIKSPLLYQQGPSTNSRVCFASLNARTGKGSAFGSETSGSDIGVSVCCAGCGHFRRLHREGEPGKLTCIAVVGYSRDGGEVCPCADYVDPGAVVEPARAERGGSGAQPPSDVERARVAMAAHFREHRDCGDGGRASMCGTGSALYGAYVAALRASMAVRR